MLTHDPLDRYSRSGEMYYIYLITNTNNEKVYVGQTAITPEQRFKNHLYSKMKRDYFHAAIRKHGSDAFIVQELGRYETREEVNNAEKLWILLTNSCDNKFGYNSTFGGDCGGPPTPETKRKIGEASSKRRHTPETKERMSIAQSGKKNHMFAIPKEQHPWFGREFTEGHKQNCSLARKAWWENLRSDPDALAAYKLNVSIGQTKRLSTPEGRKRKPLSEEGKLAIRIGQQARRAREAEEKAV